MRGIKIMTSGEIIKELRKTFPDAVKESFVIELKHTEALASFLMKTNEASKSAVLCDVKFKGD
jgi:hypothetical protein